MTEAVQKIKKPKKAWTPLFVITKRDTLPLVKRVLIRAAAIVAALLLCSVITLVVTGSNPLQIYKTMFSGAFGNSIRIVRTLYELSVLLVIAVAITPAFKMKFWNTGAEGQVLIGGLSTAIVMLTLGGRIPDWTLIIIMAAAATAAGVIWGVLPAFFKAYWKTNETLFTLMMNYVAIQLVECFLKIADKTGSNVVGPTTLSHGWFPQLFKTYYLLDVVIIAVITVLVYIYLRYSKHGYEISVVGESENTAKYVGINVKKVIIRTMALSGALCGIAGLLIVGGASHSISAETAGGRGFTAIMVSWLAKFNPLMMVFSSLLIVFLERGAGEVATVFALNKSFSDILTGIILFFIIGCEFFINYKLHFRKHSKEAAV